MSWEHNTFRSYTSDLFGDQFWSSPPATTGHLNFSRDIYLFSGPQSTHYTNLNDDNDLNNQSSHDRQFLHQHRQALGDATARIELGEDTAQSFPVLWPDTYVHGGGWEPNNLTIQHLSNHTFMYPEHVSFPGPTNVGTESVAMTQQPFDAPVDEWQQSATSSTAQGSTKDHTLPVLLVIPLQNLPRSTTNNTSSSSTITTSSSINEQKVPDGESSPPMTVSTVTASAGQTFRQCHRCAKEFRRKGDLK